MSVDISVVILSYDRVHLLERTLRTAGYVAVTSTTDPREVCGLHFENRYDPTGVRDQLPGRARATTAAASGPSNGVGCSACSGVPERRRVRQPLGMLVG